MVVSVHPVRHPFNIIDTRDTIDITDTHATIDVFQQTPFGIVSILDAFYIRDEISLCTTLCQPRFWCVVIMVQSRSKRSYARPPARPHAQDLAVVII